MKKVLALVVCLTCFAMLAACNGSSDISNIAENKEQTENEPSAAEIFYSKGSTGNLYFGENVTASKKNGYDNRYWYTPLKINVREINITDMGLTEPITIGVLSDTHLCTNASAINSFETVMQYVNLTDSVVICGDVCDTFANKSNADIFKKYFSDTYKNVFCVVGNHDKYSDNFAENVEYINNVWPHDPMYYSKAVKEKVILVGVNNGYGTFYEEQVVKLSNEIENARKNGQIIIFVHHISINTMDCTTGVNKQIYDLLTENTDVVKLALSGHMHSDSKTMVENLPVYTVEGTGHDKMQNNMLVITVK